MARKSITFAEKQDEWLKFVVQQGRYKDESDYVRDLVRRDEQKNRHFLMTKAAIQEGLDSGFSSRNLDEIWLQAENELCDKKGCEIDWAKYKGAMTKQPLDEIKNQLEGLRS